MITTIITRDEIISSLMLENGKFFHIDDLATYADKIISIGNALVLKDELGNLLSYILYYDNSPEVFITMVWTNKDFRGKGFATTLLKHMIASTEKDILLEVHSENNPAKKLYQSLHFTFEKINGDNEILKYTKL